MIKLIIFLDIGFTDEELHTLILKHSIILCMSIDNINNKNKCTYRTWL
ncbi:MAG: hypothetical protein L6V81_01530 [Clostridium sp.]|nr:MAG: hypothetical protein L6V81_01530 [Clostridium sp.]